MNTTTQPNHHHDFPAFAGWSGLLLGLAFASGRNQTGEWAADLVGVGPSDVVVDIGCGPGNAARLARKRGAAAIGVDPADVMLRLGRAFSIGRGVDFRKGSAERIPVADNSATVAWSLATVHHWKDLHAGLQEVGRILVPGGRFVAIEACTTEGATGHASHGWSDDQAERFAALCRGHHFGEVRIDTRIVDKRPRIAVIGIRD